MKRTRFEMIKELQGVLGHSEETEHIIDWIRDAWETSDFLVKRIGREHAYQIINAIEVCPSGSIQGSLAPYDHTSEHANQYLLN